MSDSDSEDSTLSLPVSVILFDVGNHARVDHVLGIQDHVELFLGQQVALQNQVIYAFTGLEGFLGDFGTVGVSDVGFEGCNDTDTVPPLRIII